MTYKERMLRNKKTAYAYALSIGIQNRTPRNGEYAGLHSNESTKRAAEMAKKHNQKIPCSANHFVYPSGLIGKRLKLKR